MSELGLGSLITTQQERDAIHVAVTPVVAGELLRPGQRVGVTDDVAIPSENVVGIVDPYLRDVVPKDAKFWLFLLPGTVTGMRHHWQHPAFVSNDSGMNHATEPCSSEQWLRAYATEMNCYDEPEMAFKRLIAGLRSGILYACGSDLHCLAELRNSDELQEHAEAYLGVKIDFNKFGFTCSC